ncbi:MAG: transcriptional coactivator p15/PC4 family protein [Deltaproteobacteria bacterium]|nr:transcriptional coactivator p15/PC4 family protein [Deltaproteobacteria bacterium]
MDKEQGEISRMQINPTDYLLFSIKEFKGKHYIDLRKYVISDSYTGFTKQGVRFGSELLKEFEENITLLKEALAKNEST